jgi:hypothetical protein
MRKLFISAILLIVVVVGANAQSKTLKMYGNGGLLFHEYVSSIDSIIFGNSNGIHTNNVYKNGGILFQTAVSSIDSIIFENSLGAPVNVSARLSNGNRSITITWSAVSGATHYEVYRSGNNTTYTLLAGNVAATTYTDNSPLTGTN